MKNAIENACFRGGKLTCSRADFENSLIVVEDIVQKIKKAGLTIFDISIPNLNVYFELGLACALDKKILLTLNRSLYYESHPREGIPFDINQFRYLEYRTTQDLEHALIKRVEALVRLDDFTKVDLQKIYTKVQKIARALQIDSEATQIKEDREISDYEEKVVRDVLQEFWDDPELKKRDFRGVRYDDMAVKVSTQFGREYYDRLKEILIYLYRSGFYKPLIGHLDRAEFDALRYDEEKNAKEIRSD